MNNDISTSPTIEDVWEEVCAIRDDILQMKEEYQLMMRFLTSIFMASVHSSDPEYLSFLLDGHEVTSFLQKIGIFLKEVK